MGESLDSKVARHDVEIIEVKRRVENLEASNNAIQELSITSERLATLVELNQKQLEKNTSVMQEMHTNLVGLNHEMKEIREDMDSVKSDVTNVNARINEVEKERIKKLKRREERRLSNRDKIIVGVATSVAVAVVWAIINLIQTIQ